jgi:hypothetical protein
MRCAATGCATWGAAADSTMTTAAADGKAGEVLP